MADNNKDEKLNNSVPQMPPPSNQNKNVPPERRRRNNPQKRPKRPAPPPKKPDPPALRVLKLIWKIIKTTLSTAGTTLLSLFLILVITTVIVGSALIVYVLEFMDSSTDISITEMEMSYASYIYVKDPETGEYMDEPVYEVQAEVQRIPVDIEDIPQYVRNAFVYAEDERFYLHEGIDYKRTAAAFANIILNFYGSAQGGSTITQQLVKNITGDDEVSPSRKIREIFRAMQLEKKYPKDEILEAYLNYIGFGGSANGIQLAAKKYYDKSVDELSIAEAASLAAIPKSPETLNPFADSEGNKERQEYVLGKMYENGVISTDEYQEALAEELAIVGSEAYNKKYGIVDEEEPEITDEENTDEETTADNDTDENSEEDSEKDDVTSWYVDTAIYEIADYLMELYDITQEEALERFNKGGYTAYLTVDLDMQEYVEQKYLDYSNFQSSATNSYGEQPQSSFIAMDYEGNILAIVGGIGEKPNSLCFNRAIQSKRQPGSCMKPVSTYGYGIESDQITWSSIFVDKPIYVDGKQWPTNYSSGTDGAWSYSSIYVYDALRKSKNTVPAQLCDLLGIDNIYNFCKNNVHLDVIEAEVTESGKYVTDRAYSPLAVGGMAYGVSIKNLVNAYQPYGTDGTFYESHIVGTLCSSGDGSVLLDNENMTGEYAVSEETAYVMNRLMREVITGGTGTAAQLSNKTVVGKTGTSQDWHDLCFVGLTPDFVSGVWIGYDTPTELNHSINSAGVWRNVIGGYANSIESSYDFPENNTVIQAQFCTSTGMIATSRCPHSSTTGYYKSSSAQYCTRH